MLVSHDVVDSVGNGTVDFLWNNELQLVQQLVLQPVERQESNKGKDENEQWGQCREERESQSLRCAP